MTCPPPPRLHPAAGHSVRGSVPAAAAHAPHDAHAGTPHSTHNKKLLSSVYLLQVSNNVLKILTFKSEHLFQNSGSKRGGRLTVYVQHQLFLNISPLHCTAPYSAIRNSRLYYISL